MRKILFGFLGIMMVVAVVAGTARALYFSTATVGGVTFATGNADLKAWNGSEWVTDYTPSNLLFSNMFPGYGGTGANETTSTKYVAFTLRNMSTSAISLDVVGKLLPGGVENPAGSWNVLKDKVYVAVVLPDWTAGTGWHTLNEWYITGDALPGGPLAQNSQREYRFYVRVDGTAGNEISGFSVSNMVYEFTGTQVTP